MIAVANISLGQVSSDLIEVNYAYPQKYIIKEIKVEGVDHLDHNTLIALSGLKIGDQIEIPGDNLTDAIKKIWNENIIGDIQLYIDKVEGDQISLVFVLVEKPRLGKVFLRGIKKKEEKDIKSGLRLARSQKISAAFERNIENQIRDYFLDIGYFNVDTKKSRIKDTTLANHVSFIFDVDKGAKVKIENIIINGNDSLTRKSILKRMKKTKERKPARIFKRSKYIDQDLEIDLQAVEDLYLSKGMRDVQINIDSIYNVGDELINIAITIDEGNVYYFRNITWVGNFKYPDKTLKKVLGLEKGQVFNQSLLDERLNFNPSGLDISSLYLDDGYLFYSLNPVEVKIENDSIDIEMRINEGAQATVSSVIVEGNTKTSDRVILREIRTIPGEKFRRSDLIRTQRELAALGYVDPAQIGIIPIPNPATGTVDIKYSVVEKPSDQLQLSGGFGGAIGFVGSLGLVFSNFSLRKVPQFKTWSPLPAGDGQRLSLRAQSNGPAFQSYSFSFTEPWLGGKKPISFTSSIYKSASNTLDDNFDKTGHIKVSGISFSVGKRLKWPDNWFIVQSAINFNKYDVDNFNSSLCTTCKANNYNISGTITRDDRGNNPQYYQKGGKITLNVAVTPPYSMFDPSIEDKPTPDRYKFIEYHKWMLDYERYHQLSGFTRKSENSVGSGSGTKRAFVLQTRAHFGYLGALNKNVGLGPFERFTVGGSGLSGQNFLLGTDIVGLRGYNDQSINPDADNGGGTIFSKYVMELRYPIVTEGAASIYVLGFMEAGNNWKNANDFDPFDLYRSTGVGIRLFMPAFGLLGLDYGVGLDPIPGRPGANTGQIHFSIGQLLR